MRLVNILWVSILTVAIVSAFAGCSSPSPPPKGPAPVPSGQAVKGPTNGPVQSSSAGGVTIEAKWAQAGNGSLVFSVVMDTHSVDLDQYDLGKLAVLLDDAGKLYRPTSWRTQPGGHHRSGTLTFPIPDSISEGKAAYVQLVIRDVAGVEERFLKWELG